MTKFSSPPPFTQEQYNKLKMSMNMIYVNINSKYLEVLEKLAELDHFKPILQSHCRLESPTDVEREIMFELQDEGIVKLLNVSRFERPTGIIKVPGDISQLHQGIEFELIQPAFEQYCSDFEADYTKPNSSDYFGFDDGSFWVKRADGEKLSVIFNPKTRETSDTFLLCYALVNCLKANGKWKDDWLHTYVSKKQVADVIQNSQFKKVEVTSRWLSSTKRNLIDKLSPAPISQIVNLGSFDNNENGYPFRIKIPH